MNRRCVGACEVQKGNRQLTPLSLVALLKSYKFHLLFNTSWKKVFWFILWNVSRVVLLLKLSCRRVAVLSDVRSHQTNCSKLFDKQRHNDSRAGTTGARAVTLVC